MSETMRAMAIVNKVAEMVEVPKPTPGNGEIRVKIIAASVNPAEDKLVNGEFVGRFLHARISPLILGWDFAGTIDAFGECVTDLKEGTPVWGHLAYSNSTKQGTFAEYITIPRTECAVKPNDVPFHIAAATPTISMTALQSMRDLGGLSKDGKVLIIGAGNIYQ